MLLMGEVTSRRTSWQRYEDTLDGSARAEAGAVMLAAERRFHLAERCENFLQIVLGDADAGVAHYNVQVAVG